MYQLQTKPIICPIDMQQEVWLDAPAICTMHLAQMTNVTSLYTQ